MQVWGTYTNTRDSEELIRLSTTGWKEIKKGKWCWVSEEITWSEIQYRLIQRFIWHLSYKKIRQDEVQKNTLKVSDNLSEDSDGEEKNFLSLSVSLFINCGGWSTLDTIRVEVFCFGWGKSHSILPPMQSAASSAYSPFREWRLAVIHWFLIFPSARNIIKK